MLLLKNCYRSFIIREWMKKRNRIWYPDYHIWQWNGQGFEATMSVSWRKDNNSIIELIRTNTYCKRNILNGKLAKSYDYLVSAFCTDKLRVCWTRYDGYPSFQHSYGHSKSGVSLYWSHQSKTVNSLSNQRFLCHISVRPERK